MSTEARLEEELHRAREEAAALLTATREAAAVREAALAADLEVEEQRLEREIAEERRRREAEILERTTRDGLAFDGVGSERIEALARWVVDQVIGAGP